MEGLMRGRWGEYGMHDEQVAGWRKGPWTPEEDKLLSEYVNLHGEGRWSSVSKCTGLKRSGKSSRLRWVNYLRPGLKRGQLTPQEEGIVIELHAIWGNKWSTIASYLPGRTDNEIKNYWRTHFKKRPSILANPKPKRTRTTTTTSTGTGTSSSASDFGTIHQQTVIANQSSPADQQAGHRRNIQLDDTSVEPPVGNQWPSDDLHRCDQLLPAAFGSGPIVEDWLWSGLWNF